MATRRKYDLVVFGATGFTGQFIVEEIARTISSEKAADGGALRWAVAGRDMTKLQAALAEATTQTGIDLSDVQIIIADVKNEKSLNEMCSQAELILNCVGPYRLYGTPVVKACIANRTSHIDISGEPQWLEGTELEYGDQAKDAGVYILQACGFDSIPTEMGIQYTRKQFQGFLHSVESYLSIKFGQERGANLNYGTWLSALYSIANFSELKEIRRKLYTYNLPKSSHNIKKRFPIFYSEDVQGWCLPLPEGDKSIVYRSQVTNHRLRKQTPIHFEPYFRCGDFHYLIGIIFGALIFAILAFFSFGQKLLEDYPSLMSFGIFSKNGPSRKQIAGASVRMTFIGIGYEKNQSENSGPPKKRIVTSLVTPELAYLTTSMCIVHAAYTFLAEKDKLPPGGGVLTPGAAFEDTTLLTRLQQRGLEFSVVEQ